MTLVNLIENGNPNWGTLWTEIIFVTCVVVLFGRWQARSRIIAHRLVEMVLLYALWFFLDVSCYYLEQVTGLDLSQYQAPTFASLFGALALYALIHTEIPLADRLVRSVVFACTFVINVGFVSTVLPATGLMKVLTNSFAVPSILSYMLLVVVTVELKVLTLSRFSYIPYQSSILVMFMALFGAYMGRLTEETVLFYSNIRSDSYYSVQVLRFESTLSTFDLVVSVGFFLLICVGYALFYLLAKEHEARTELLITKKSDEDAATMMSVTQQTYSQLREMRHELKNHDAYMSALLERGDYDHMREYFSAYKTKNAEVMGYVSCGNQTVDAVVNAKKTLAASRGIELKSMLAVPAELPFSDSDVYRLLANLLDNAIENTPLTEVADAPGAEDDDVATTGDSASAAPARPVICLTIKPEGAYWFVTVTNPCETSRLRFDSDGLLKTSKRDPVIHGYGTKVIRHIAEDHDGVARFTIKDNVFSAQVMLMDKKAAGALGR